ncbi:type 1 glutamine amidotransferase domain-containing protein [Micromonospora arborensis]|uniref:type 1 glutamine amidotransferase domain-containing protein n=1 Tax=Micromonospora arborensis TaxID=2116518 RepID=UPI00142DE864|nr:type 1 glutamine amidotransferase domain-containing protein [Micromonospora arborensis]
MTGFLLERGRAMPRVLLVLTSHGQLGSTGIATGVGLQTFASPYYLLTEAGIDVQVASPMGGQPPVDPLSFGDGVETAALRRLSADKEAQSLLEHTMALPAVDSERYDGLFFTGGHGGMWDLPENESAGHLISAALSADKPVVAVCHGVAALCSPDPVTGHAPVKGRRVTGLSNREEVLLGRHQSVPFLLQDRLTSLGAVFEEAAEFSSHVVVDNQLITGQNMRSADQASRALLAVLNRS